MRPEHGSPGAELSRVDDGDAAPESELDRKPDRRAFGDQDAAPTDPGVESSESVEADPRPDVVRLVDPA